jgi:hypothetical protein
MVPSLEIDSMASVATRRGRKTQFVKEFLGKNPRANAAAVNLAWKAEGKEGTVSATLVNKLRSTLGLAGNLRRKRKPRGDQLSLQKLPYTGKKRGRKPKNLTIGAPVATPLHSNGRRTRHKRASLDPRGKLSLQLGSLEDVEADIDRLIFKVMALGGMPALEDTLRRARRLLYGALTGNRP